MDNIHEKLKFEIEALEGRRYLGLEEIKDLTQQEIDIMKLVLQRGKVGLNELRDTLGLSLSEAEEILSRLTSEGYMVTSRKGSELNYHIHHSYLHKPEISSDIWVVLRDKVREIQST